MKATLFVLFVCLTTLPSAFAQETVEVRGVLVKGVQQSADLPEHMKGIQQLLHKNLAGRFKGFEFQGRGQQDIAVGKSGKITLPENHLVDVQVASAEPGKIALKIQWSRQGKSLARMDVNSNGRAPVIVGGPAAPGGNLILLLQAK